ncbi:MAG: DNA repair protein RecN [Verrucomicrobia bacterium]|nr:DNA repair protein RecN [Verrucomicrobiota bacterium]
MIKTLIIKNLILIEEAHVQFDSGLTMITGETGAGKTALIEAIRLILGERADASKVRKGCDKAFIQASFELDKTPPILIEAGVNVAEDEELILTREISTTGKSRAFIAGQMVPASLLQNLAPYLVDFIAQHAQVSLKSSENQRELLDLYADIDRSDFQLLWEKEKELQGQIDILQERKKTQKEPLLRDQLDELFEANLKPEEEEALFGEYSLLTNAQELLSSTSQIIGETDVAIQRCNSITSLFNPLLKFDPKLEETQAMAKEARLQLIELSSALESFQAKIESDPGRLNIVEERLKMYDRLKRKYGKDLIVIQNQIEKELESLESIDQTIEQLTEELKEIKEKTSAACQEISKKRQKGAIKLGKQLSAALQQLNIPSAEITIQVEKAARSKTGEDTIHFYLQANAGEAPTLVKDSSSGGEMSRLLFSLKLILAEKSQPKTMVFDEIDANVGGETARIMGQKLKELGEVIQVLCITHFPQVARQGDHHLRVLKEENEQRTVCKLSFVQDDEREAELLRMAGNTQKIGFH